MTMHGSGMMMRGSSMMIHQSSRGHSSSIITHGSDFDDAREQRHEEPVAS